MRFFLVGLMLLGNMMISAFALAATPEVALPTNSAVMTPEEEDIHLRAKKRLYPGGRDEESLRVQAQLPAVTRKLSPTTEAPSDEPAVYPSND